MEQAELRCDHPDLKRSHLWKLWVYSSGSLHFRIDLQYPTTEDTERTFLTCFHCLTDADSVFSSTKHYKGGGKGALPSIWLWHVLLKQKVRFRPQIIWCSHFKHISILCSYFKHISIKEQKCFILLCTRTVKNASVCICMFGYMYIHVHLCALCLNLCERAKNMHYCIQNIHLVKISNSIHVYRRLTFGRSEIAQQWVFYTFSYT